MTPKQLLDQVITPADFWRDNADIDVLALEFKFPLKSIGEYFVKIHKEEKTFNEILTTLKISKTEMGNVLTITGGDLVISDIPVLDGDMIIFQSDSEIDSISPSKIKVVNNNYLSLLRRCLRIYSQKMGLSGSFVSLSNETNLPTDFFQIVSVTDSDFIPVRSKIQSQIGKLLIHGGTPPYQVDYLLRIDQQNLNSPLPSDIDESLIIELLSLHMEFANQRMASVTGALGVNFNDQTPDAAQLRESINNLLDRIDLSSNGSNFIVL